MAPATKAKKVGKENAPPKSKVVEEFDIEVDGSIADVSMELSSGIKPASKAAAKSRKDEEEAARPAERKGASDTSKKFTTLAAENDRLREQRDEFAKQFDDLSRIRNTESEKLFEKQKQNTEVQAKAQNDIIASLTALAENQAGRIAELQKSKKQLESAGPAPAPVVVPPPPPSDLNKSDLKELKALREEVLRLRAGVKEQDQKIVQLEKEYKAEVEQSRTLLHASTRAAPSLAASTSVPPQTEESEKDAVCLSFYEDLTELQIVNVKLKRDPKNGKEAVLNCLYTNHEQKRSLQFKIRTFHELSQELVAEKAENPWVRMIHFAPENLANETDKEFVKRLDHFATEFAVPRTQLGTMWTDLQTKVSGEESDDDE